MPSRRLRCEKEILSSKYEQIRKCKISMTETLFRTF